MTLRAAVFAAVLVLSAGAVVYGVSLVSIPAAWVMGGTLSVALSWLVLSE